MLIIGIDPGKNTGIAIYDPTRKVLTEVYMAKFWDAVELMRGLSRQDTVVIELPASKHVHHDEAVNKGAIQRTGVNVGSVIRESELLIELAGILKLPCIIQRPGGKTKAKAFKKITGWTGRTNQHNRDAGMLCYGMSISAHANG